MDEAIMDALKDKSSNILFDKANMLKHDVILEYKRRKM